MKKLYSPLRGAAVLALAALWTHASALELESDKLYGYVCVSRSYYDMAPDNFYSFDKAAPSASAGVKIGSCSYLSYKPDQAGTFIDGGDFVGVGKQSSYSTTKIIMRLSLGSDGNWSMTKNVTAPFTNVTSMTNDNGTLYIWYQKSAAEPWLLGTVDPETLDVTPVGTAGTSTKIMTMAAGDGQLYGIDNNGSLYGISKDDG